MHRREMAVDDYRYASLVPTAPRNSDHAVAGPTRKPPADLAALVGACCGERRLIGRSEAIRRVLLHITRVMSSDAAVCIQGETGTGKELVARAIHFGSPRHDYSFVVQDCAALPETLLESELFGYARGAFTGAHKDKKGLFELADGGTLFLDELSSASAALQVKLLRMLQEGEFTPIGSTRPKRVDVRIISATNAPLAELVQQGKLRPDLFYRLHVYPIDVPPLRERKEDIPLIADFFLQRMAQKMRKRVHGISGAAVSCLMAHDFPGNVRELEHEIERAVIMCQDHDEQLEVEHLSEKIAHRRPPAAAPKSGARRLKEQLRDKEASLIIEALSIHGGNVTHTAIYLGLSRRGLTKKIKQLGIVSGARC
jgi:transcriptional regulator with PAS, ATPase and Fis domain